MGTTNIDRTNRANTGKSFEAELSVLFAELERKGAARIRKVDPPTRVIGGGFRRRVILLPNPFLDYVGTIAGGRAVFIEAKSTATGRLPFCRSGGLTEEQWQAMRGWHAAGAAVLVLWRQPAGTAVLTVPSIAATRAAEPLAASLPAYAFPGWPGALDLETIRGFLQ